MVWICISLMTKEVIICTGCYYWVVNFYLIIVYGVRHGYNHFCEFSSSPSPNPVSAYSFCPRLALHAYQLFWLSHCLFYFFYFICSCALVGCFCYQFSSLLILFSGTSGLFYLSNQFLVRVIIFFSIIFWNDFWFSCLLFMWVFKIIFYSFCTFVFIL
jgi:hypothetical protein